MEMDRDLRRFLQSVLPRLVEPPPDTTDYMDMMAYQMVMVTSPPDPMLSVRQRLFHGDNYRYEGKYVFSSLCGNRYQFYCFTGETPETMTQLLAQLTLNEQGYRLSSINRVLLFIIWIRQYFTFTTLASIFGISVTTVRDELSTLLTCFETFLNAFVKWPSLAEWRARKGRWNLEPIVGAIDGTSHEILRPMNEPQQQYFSGHRQFHCVHSQVVVDNEGSICYIESGFMGHLNDAQQYNLMDEIDGPMLPFPDECVLIGDKIYPNRHPIVTPYSTTQLNRRYRRHRRKCVKFNRMLIKCRVTVEHSIAELKAYKAVSSVWRQKRQLLPRIVKLCCGFVNRRKSINLVF